VYSWRNGVSVENLDYSVDSTILPWGNLLSLEDALDIDADNKKNGDWRPTLKPFFANFEGEHYLVETDKLSGRYGMIFFYSPNMTFATDPVPYFDNLEAMLITIMKSFEAKAQWYDYEKSFNAGIDYNLAEKITQE